MARKLLPTGGMGSDPRASLGRRGEDLACEVLRRRGYTVVERGFRTRTGEIDIIARDGPTTVFVEVRTRSGGSFGSPLESVNGQKRRRLCRMAAEYLAARRAADAACRFDVVSIVEERGAPPSVDVVRGAFGLDW
jgi:putative endonuclease